MPFPYECGERRASCSSARHIFIDMKVGATGESTIGLKGSSNRPPDRDVALERCLWLAASILVAWSFGYALVPGSDLWWHVAAGRWMLAHGDVPSADPFGFTTSDAVWRNHE